MNCPDKPKANCEGQPLMSLQVGYALKRNKSVRVCTCPFKGHFTQIEG